MFKSHPKGVITKGKGSLLIELLTAFITYHYEVILYNFIFTFVLVQFFSVERKYKHIIVSFIQIYSF